MELGGAWRAAEVDDALRRTFPDPGLDDSAWAEVQVPGHWRSSAAFAGSDGPVAFRRSFESDAGRGGGEDRQWLVFDGLFYQGDVWLDGSYLGDTEGYFVPHSFEVTDAMASRSEHTLAVEVDCARPVDRTAKRALTGVFGQWDCIDPDWNPGGIWAPVHLERSGLVRISQLKVLCRDARAERAIVHLEAVLDASRGVTVGLTTQVSRGGGRADQAASDDPVVERRVEETLGAGRNRVRWRVTVDHPALWWPRALGGQPLHRVAVKVDVAGAVSDERQVVTGLRQVRMRNFTTTVNGERLFLKGANAGPVRRELADVTASECERDVRLATDAGLDLLRVHAHISSPWLYDAADRAGLLLWQDLPLQWGYANVRRQAVRQARHAVSLLGHHPSIAVWCGHNEPLALDMVPGQAPDGPTRRRYATGQVLPSFNRTVLDGSLRRVLERTDGSRPVVAHSGVLPHPVGGTDSHLYFGWYHGDERDLPALLRRFPVLARFVSEFGAQAVPDTDAWIGKESWPALDWERLGRAHGLQKAIFDRRVPPADHVTFDSWRRATQEYQASLLRHHVEALRRLKYRPTGGFCQFLLADAQPAVSWSILDHERRPKSGYAALAAACAPVIVVAERPAEAYHPGTRVRLDVHAVNDLRTPLTDAKATATLSWPGQEGRVDRRTWRFGGDVGADSCTRVGRVEHTLPATAAPGTVRLILELAWSGRGDGPPGQGGGHVANSYRADLRARA